MCRLGQELLKFHLVLIFDPGRLLGGAIDVGCSISSDRALLVFLKWKRFVSGPVEGRGSKGISGQLMGFFVVGVPARLGTHSILIMTPR